MVPVGSSRIGSAITRRTGLCWPANSKVGHDPQFLNTTRRLGTRLASGTVGSAVAGIKPLNSKQAGPPLSSYEDGGCRLRAFLKTRKLI